MKWNSRSLEMIEWKNVTADVLNVDCLRNHVNSAKNGIDAVNAEFQIWMNVFATMMKSTSIVHHVSEFISNIFFEAYVHDP